MHLVSLKASCQYRRVNFLEFLKSKLKILGLLEIAICSSAFALPKVITTSPAITELVFQLGYGNQILAVSHFSDYPEQAKSLPRIGSLFLPSIEKVLIFSPDWVLIDHQSTPLSFSEKLTTLNIKHVQISVFSVSSLFEQARKILTEVFQQTETTAIENRLRNYQTIQKQLLRKFTFIALAWPSPTTLIGRRTFLSDLLTQVGGENLLKDSVLTPYPQVATDWLIKNEPDILFVLGDSKEQLSQTEKLASKWWKTKKTKVILLHSDLFARTTFTPLEHLIEILGPQP